MVERRLSQERAIDRQVNAVSLTDRHKTAADEREIPRDDRLPGLSTLLDAGKVQAILAPRVSAAVGEDFRISYVRYKPATSCVVMYTLRYTDGDGKRAEMLFYGKCYKEDDYANAVGKADTQQWVTVANLEPVIPAPELCAIFYVYPNDCELTGLRLIAHPKKMQRILYDNLAGYPNDEWRISDKQLRTTTVRFKPEKRAVVRFDTRAKHRQTRKWERVCVYMRSYCDDRGKLMFEVMKKLHETFDKNEQLIVPRPLVYLADKRLLLMEGLPGKPVLARLLGSSGSKYASNAGAALAELHRFDDRTIPVRSPRHLLDDVRLTGDTLSRVAPETRQEVGSLVEMLAGGQPEEVVSGFVHGDFYHGQILVHKGPDAILDFDRSYRGDSVADIGNFCAHLRQLTLQGRLSGWKELQDAFVDGYERAGAKPDRDRLRFWTAVGLFQLSVGPFRSLQPGWMEKTAAILRACRSVLT